MSPFDGVITALVTPFYKGEIDFDSVKKLVAFQMDHGVSGFVINGTTGESPTLSYEEVTQLYSCIRGEVGDSVPLIVGTGSNCTRKTIELTSAVKDWGADAALVVTPYYNKPPQRGLEEHFKKVAHAGQLPIILYNVPGRTVTSLSLELIERLSRVSNIVGIKEASADIEFGKNIVQACGKDFLVTSGDDGSCLELAVQGGGGVISVISHLIPGQLVNWFHQIRSGDKLCIEEFKRYGELLEAVYSEANPIPIKMALYLKGLIKSPELRLPLVALEDVKVDRLKNALEEMELL